MRALPSAAAPTSTESQAAPGMPQGGAPPAEARGDVTVVSKDQNASGDLGVYDMKTKTITLTGNVVISQGKNVVRGERVVVNTVTGDARVNPASPHDPAKSGGTTHDRVRVLIVPAKDAKGAPTNTMTFEEAPSHPH